MLPGPDKVPDDFELPEDRITYHDDGRVTYRLRYPPTLTLKGATGEREETVTELTLRRLNGEDLEIGEKARSATAASEAIVTRLAGIASPVYKKLDAYDLLVIAVLVGNFTKASQLTGGAF